VLDDDQIMYYPEAFSTRSRAILRELFPGAILATDADARVLGLNAVSDGWNVILPESGNPLGERTPGTWFPSLGDRPVRAAEGGRWRQVLHPGAPRPGHGAPTPEPVANQPGPAQERAGMAGATMTGRSLPGSRQVDDVTGRLVLAGRR
jgi:hypothetical protein